MLRRQRADARGRMRPVYESRWPPKVWVTLGIALAAVAELIVRGSVFR